MYKLYIKTHDSSSKADEERWPVRRIRHAVYTCTIYVVFRCIRNTFYILQVMKYHKRLYDYIIRSCQLTYALLSLSSRLNYNCTITERFWRTIVAIGCIVTALLVTYSRVYLLYHSNTQVVWGALIGITLGSAWFLIMHMILTPFFPIVVSW